MARKETTHFGYETVPAEDKAGRVGAVFDAVAGRYDLMNDLMSGGLHRLWKEALVDYLAPRPGERILDVAGGTGDVARRILRRIDAMARRHPGMPRGGSVVLCDINPRMLARGRRHGATGGAATLLHMAADAEALPIADRSADAYTIAFGIRNVTRIDRALAEAARVLRPGGRFLCLEFSRVVVPGLESLYDAWSFRVIPEIGALIARNRDAYRYLVESIRRFPDQEDFADMIRTAGLERVAVRNLAGGIVALHSAWRL